MRWLATSGRGGRRAVWLASLMVMLGTLLGLAGLAERVGQRDAAAHTARTLIALDEAVELHTRHRPRRAGEHPATTRDLLRDLLTDPAAAPRLRGLTIRVDIAGERWVADGYGQPIEYLSPRIARRRGGDFVSAGPDRRRGNPQSPDPVLRRALTDDVYASHLR